MFGIHKSIAAGEILNVINGIHPTQGDQHVIDQNRWREGQLMKQIVKGDIPQSLLAVGLVDARHPKHAFIRDVGGDVELHAHPDLESKDMIVTLETGRIQMRQVLKATMASVARGSGGDVAVHLFFHDQTYYVRGGGEMIISEVESITLDAFTIYENQQAINKKIGGLGVNEKYNLKKQTAEIGARLHNTVENACRILHGNMMKFG